MKVHVDVEEAMLTNDRGTMIPGVIVTCSECGESVQVFGTSEASIRRGCANLKELCMSNNWYTPDDE